MVCYDLNPISAWRSNVRFKKKATRREREREENEPKLLKMVITFGSRLLHAFGVCNDQYQMMDCFISM